MAMTENQTILISTDDQIYRVTCSEDQRYTATLLVGKCGKGESVDGRAEECSFKGPLLGIAVHEASHSCFVTENYGHTVRKITFKD